MQDDTRSTRRSILGAAGVAGASLALSGQLGRNATAAEQGREQTKSGTRLASENPPENKARVVGFPLYQGATLLDFAGATQIFAFAGMTPIWLAPQLTPIA